MADDITLKMNVDVSDAEASISRFNKATQQAFSSSDKRVQQMGANLGKVSSDIEKTISAMKSMERTQPKTTEMELLDNVIKQIEADLKKAQVAQARLDATGNNQGQKYQDAVDKVRDLSTQLNRARTLQEYLNKEQVQGPPAISGDYKGLQDRLTALINKANLLTRGIQDAGDKSSTLRRVWERIQGAVVGATRSLKGFKSNVGSTAEHHNMSFKKMLTQVLKYGFGIRSIFLLYKKLRTEIKKGLGIMGAVFPEIQADINAIANSFTAFKASLTSAFQPIFSFVVPALTTLINYLTSAMNALANFFAVLTGQGHYYKAIKGNNNYAKSVGGAGKAAKEANEELAEYDKLIVINQDKTGGGGGGGGGGADDAGYEWEKTATHASDLANALKNMWGVVKKAWKDSKVFDEMQTALKNIKSLAETIGKTFYKVFMQGYGYAWLYSLFTLLGSVFRIIGKIAKAFETAWKEGARGEKLVRNIFRIMIAINKALNDIAIAFEKAWDDYGVQICGLILDILTGVLGVVIQLVNRFREAWNANNNGYKIMRNILGTFKDVLQAIKDLVVYTEEWAKSLNLTPLLNSISTITSSIRNTVNIILGYVKSIYKDFVLPIIKELVENAVPKLIEDIAGFLDDINTTLEDIKPTFDIIMGWLRELTKLTIDSIIENIGLSFEGFGAILKTVGGIVKWVAPLLDDVNNGLKEARRLLGIDKDNKKKPKSDMELALDVLFQKWKSDWKTHNLLGPLGTVLKIFNDFKGELIKTIDTIGDAPKTLWGKFVTGIRKFFVGETLGEVAKKNNASGIPSDVKNKIVGESGLSKLGKEVWEGFKSGFIGAIAWPAPVRVLYKKLVEAIKSIFGIHSPATSMKPYGKSLFDGIVQGFKNAISVKKIKQLIKTKLLNKLKGAVTFVMTVKAIVDDTFTKAKKVWDEFEDKKATITSVVKEAVKGAVDKLRTSWEAIKTKTASLYTALKENAQQKVDNFKNALNEIKDKTANVWANIKDDAQKKVDALKGSLNWFKSNPELATNLTSTIKESGNTTIETFSSLWKSIKDGTNKTVSAVVGLTRKTTGKGSWTTVGDWVTRATGNKNKVTASVGLSKGWDGSMDDWAQRNVNTGIWATVNLAKGNFSTVAGWLVSQFGQMNVVKNKDSITVKEINHALGGVFDAMKGVWSAIPQYARGGLPNHGTLFAAGEAGAEVVGHIGGRTEVLNKSQLASVMHSAIVDGMMSVVSKILPLSISVDMPDIPIPDIVNGTVLPLTEAFMFNFEEQHRDFEDVKSLLQQILTATNNPDNDEQPPIVLQVDRRVLAQIVWDETNKRYKQTGRNNLGYI